MVAAPSAKASPTGSSPVRLPSPSSTTPAAASPAHTQRARPRPASTDSVSGPSTSMVTATPSGIRAIAA